MTILFQEICIFICYYYFLQMESTLNFLCQTLYLFQFKNVYEQMGYKAPFSSEDLETVLDRINNEPVEVISKFISKPKAELIVNHRPFEVAEQLLDLKGFNLKILENFLSKLCDQDTSGSAEKSKCDASLKKEKELLRSIKPKVVKTFFQNNVSSLVGVSFNLFSVSFVHMTKEKKILSW